eukprot:3818462-Amphidinium_carterae.1
MSTSYNAVQPCLCPSPACRDRRSQSERMPPCAMSRRSYKNTNKVDTSMSTRHPDVGGNMTKLEFGCRNQPAGRMARGRGFGYYLIEAVTTTDKARS